MMVVWGCAVDIHRYVTNFGFGYGYVACQCAARSIVYITGNVYSTVV